MPLPTWYRVMRALPGVLAGSLFVGIGLYLALAPTSYRDPNNPKMVAYANSMHPVVILMGVAAVLGGLVLLFFGARLFFRLPASLREYTYEQLRLGRMLAREIIRLTPDEPHYRSVEYDGGGKASISGRSTWKSSWWNPKEWSFFFDLGESVTFVRTQPATEIDGVLHVPELRFYIDSFTGKASRHESVEDYVTEESFPLDPDSPLGYAIRSLSLDTDDTEEDPIWMVQPDFQLVRVAKERPGIEEIVNHHEFLRQMGLDKPSVEELQLALDELRAW